MLAEQGGGVMLDVDIPGFGQVKVKYFVSDFTGTLSSGGKLLPGVKDRLHRVADIMEIRILTADTFGVVKKELEGVRCSIKILEGEKHDEQKREYVLGLSPDKVIAFGNGNNDRKMLKTARIGIAVSEGEGCSVDALTAADIHVNRAIDALDLMLNPKRLKATLRF